MVADNSSQLPYQVCLIPNLPEETQHQIRDFTNHVARPVNALLAVMSIVCNGLVVITVARTKYLQQPPLLMLCSLAMTDVLFSQYFLLRYIIAILAHEYMCPNTSIEIASLFPLCTLATLGNLAVISRDRYLAVRKPWWYRSHVTKSRAIKLICASWLISVVISITMYLSKKFHDRFSPIGQITSLLFYLICFFVIILSCFGLYCKKTPPKEVLQRAILEREKRTANTVALILLVLSITFLPGLLFPLILYTKDVGVQPFRPFYSFLLVINGFLNPLLNFGRNREMRRALRNLFKCSQQVQPSSAASAAQQPATATTRAAAL